MEGVNKTEIIPDSVKKFQEVFVENIASRICVVGASCVGKSTLLKFLPKAVDMDDLLFGSEEKGIRALLSQDEIDYVCGHWTPEVGDFMKKKALELIKVEPGRPVFGTIVFPSDLVIEITVPDNVLRERIRRRNANETDVFSMKKQIEDEIAKSGITQIEIEN